MKIKPTNLWVPAFFLWAALPLGAAPATYTVTNANDSGAGSLRQAILDADSNAGSTIAFSGPLSIDLSSDLPALTADTTLNPGGQFIEDAGAGGLSITAGTLQFAQGSLVDSGVFLSGGTAQIEVDDSQSATIGGLAGSGAVTLDPGSWLDFGLNNQSTTYFGPLGGGGTLEKSGTGNASIQTANVDLLYVENGTFTLTGSLGNSPVSLSGNGILDISNSPNPNLASLSGSGMVSFGSANPQIDFNDASTTFSGTLVGIGTVEKEGTGTFSLNGTLLSSGGVSVNDGLLIVGDDSNPSALVTGPVEISGTNAATLMGTGRIQGQVTVETGAHLDLGAPGESLRVGSLMDLTGANTQLNFNLTDASNLRVDQGAQLAGPLSLVNSAGSSYGNLHYAYEIVSAGSVTGAFAIADLDSTLASYLSATLGYGPRAVTLFLNQTGFTFKPLADTANAAAVAGALDASLLTAGNGFGAKLNELYALPSGQSQAMDRMAGSLYPSIPAFLFDNARFQADFLFERMEEDAAPSPPPLRPQTGAFSGIVNALAPQQGNSSSLGKGLWLESLDSFGSWNAGEAAPAFTQDHVGILGGFDGELGPGFKGGVEGSYSHGTLSAEDGSGSLQSDSVGVGAYAQASLGGVKAGLLLNGAVDSLKTGREVSIGSDLNNLAGSFSAQELTAAFQLSEPLDLQGVTWEPLEGIQYVRLSEPKFSETGSALALSESARAVQSLRAFGGFALHQGFSLGGQARLVPALRLTGGAEMLQPSSQAPLSFAQSGSGNFPSNGFAQDPFFVELDLSAALILSPGTEFFAGYNGGFGQDQNLNSVEGGLQLAL